MLFVAPPSIENRNNGELHNMVLQPFLRHSIAAHDLGNFVLSNADEVICACDRSVIGVVCIIGGAAEPDPTVDARGVRRA
ncbi:MAG: hypothetical protein JO095_07755 [Alphaproteobacteria bacterium]|nr:hypothetical protein [Alphaproteobacteria bacterium]